MSNVKEVILNNALASSLESASRMRLPYECCGVVYGTLANGGVLTADGFSLIRNRSASPIDTFAFHPEDWISAYYDAQKNQREIVGFFHSHPQRAPIPSLSDGLGYIPWGTYWIVGLSGDDCEIAIYVRDSQDGWIPLPITRQEP